MSNLMVRKVTGRLLKVKKRKYILQQQTGVAHFNGTRLNSSVRK